MPSTTQDFKKILCYIDRDFKIILTAFDILIKYDSDKSIFKITKVQKENGYRSIIIRKLILEYVLKYKDGLDDRSQKILDSEYIEMINNYVERKKLQNQNATNQN